KADTGRITEGRIALAKAHLRVAYDAIDRHYLVNRVTRMRRRLGPETQWNLSTFAGRHADLNRDRIPDRAHGDVTYPPCNQLRQNDGCIARRAAPGIVPHISDHHGPARRGNRRVN